MSSVVDHRVSMDGSGPVVGRPAMGWSVAAGPVAAPAVSRKVAAAGSVVGSVVAVVAAPGMGMPVPDGP
jgi:hypothetical protein